MRSTQRNVILAVLIFSFVSLVFGQTTEFTYQGSLRDSGNPANGNYDFEFALYDSLVGGTLLTTPLARNAVTVSDGSFAVKLDFGNQFPGANRFLEIRVRLSGQPSMTVLAPRQQLNSIPYAVRSVSADSALNAQNAVNATNATNATNAANATNATTATNALSLGGVVAGQYVLTGDARLSDARAPLAGSSNYIQNQSAAIQPVTSFNIFGVGKAGSFDARGSYYIAGIRNLSMDGTGNLFVGANSGIANTSGQNNVFAGQVAGYRNTTGTDNAFFGFGAGYQNTTGHDNAFFGGNAGSSNLQGSNNAFFGKDAGALSTGSQSAFFGNRAGMESTSTYNNSYFGFAAGRNVTTGQSNAFFGAGAGGGPTDSYNSFFGVSSGSLSGSNNSFFGEQTGLNTSGDKNTLLGGHADGAYNLTNATAIGYAAKVTQSNSMVLGSIAGTWLGTANTNVGIGTTAPGNRLHIVGSFNSTATSGNHVALIENSSTGTSPDVLALRIGRATDPDSSNNFITFFKGDNSSVGSIQGNSAGGVMLGGPGSDYAEWLPRLNPGEKIEPGDIVGLFDGRISKTTAGASQVMAVSTGAIVAGNDPGENRRESHSLIAFIGQVMVKVVGSVEAGDFVIPSGLGDGSGIAISSETISQTQFGNAIGQAWESSDDIGLKRVRVAVGLIRSDPTTKRLYERTRNQEDEIRSLQRQINGLKKLICAANQQAGICKEERK